MLVRAEGGKGSIDLAKAVIDACDHAKKSGTKVKYLYPMDMPIKVGNASRWVAAAHCPS